MPHIAGILASFYVRLENLENIAVNEYKSWQALDQGFLDGTTGFYGIIAMVQSRVAASGATLP